MSDNNETKQAPAVEARARGILAKMVHAIENFPDGPTDQRNRRRLICEAKALLAEAGAGEPIYQCMCTDDDDAEHNQYGRDLWMDVPKQTFNELSKRADVRSRIVYADSQPVANGGAALTYEHINETWKRANGEELENNEFGAMVVAFAQTLVAPQPASEPITCTCMKCGKRADSASPCAEAYCPIMANGATSQPASEQQAAGEPNLAALSEVFREAILRGDVYARGLVWGLASLAKDIATKGDGHA